MFVWIKRGFLPLAILGLLFTGAAQAQNGQGRGNGAGAPDNVVQMRPTGPVPGQYIVVFEDDVADPRGLANALARRNGFGVQHVYEFALKGFAGNMPARVAAALADDPDVAYVEQDIYAHAVAQSLGTGIMRTDADLNAIAHIDGVDGAFDVERVDVDIAILDTGVDFDHPDLNVFRRVNCANGGPFTQKCKDGQGDDGYGHGTHVAGIAAALDNDIGVVGMAPGARIWSLKVLGDDGSGWFSWSIAALDYVTQHAGEIEVANMSLGGQGTLASLREAIQSAVNAGVVVVVAAGNALRDVYGADGFGTGDESIPASYPEAMTVSAMADFDGVPGGEDPRILNFNACEHSGDDVFACFTNFSNSVVFDDTYPVYSPGLAIDVAGPGMSILSTLPGGDTYEAWSGTSMAAPHVAGAVALYIVEYGRATDAAGVAAIRQALIDSAEPQEDWRTDDGEGANLATGDPDGNHEGLVNALGGPANYAPEVSIVGPTDGATFDSGATIDFSGSAADEDGNLTAGLSWTSDLVGQIGNGAGFSTTLSDGTHTITAEVSDSDGKTGSASISITVGTPNEAPNVSIITPGDGDPFDSGATIDFSGSAPDENGDLSAGLIWTSDLVGQIGNGAGFSTTLSDGTHTITAEVSDSDDKTGSASISITVGAAPSEVSVASIVFGRHGGRGGTKHLLITVAIDDDLGIPVEGALVTLEIFGPKGGTGSGTTLANGTVAFSLKNAPDCTKGDYTATVKGVVTAAGLDWDPLDPANTVTGCL